MKVKDIHQGDVFLEIGSIQGHEIIGNKTIGRISKRVFQEKKAPRIFRKTNISWRALFSSDTRFEIPHFALLPT